MSERSYIPGLNGLRALACTGVFAVHWQQRADFAWTCGYFDLKRLLLNGNTGVACLFLLSGLLLALPIWSDGRQQQGALRFAVNRLSRILPAYYLCLTVLVVHERLWSTSQGLRATILHYALLHNLNGLSFYAIAPPFWTLAVQAQFYLLFSLLLWPLHRARRRSARLLGGILLLLAVSAYFVHLWVLRESAAIGLALVGEPFSASGRVLSRSLLAHCPIFFLGAALGAFRPGTRQELGKRASRLADTLCLVCLVIVLVVLSTPLDGWLQITGGRYNLPYIPVLLGALIVGVPRSHWMQLALELRPVRWLGAISYGFYVYHYPCMSLTDRFLGKLDLGFRDQPLFAGLVSYCLSVLVAAVSFYLLERPIMRAVKPRSVSVAA